MHVIVHAGFTPFLGGALRMSIAGAIMLVVARMSGFGLPERRALKHLAISGTLYLLGGNGLTMVASQYVPSGFMALISATTPFWLTAGAAIMPPRERPSLMSWLGTFTGFAGVLVFVGADIAEAPEGIKLGVMATLFAALFWACAALWAKRTLREVPSAVTSAWQMLIGSAALALVGFVRGEAATFAPQRHAIPAFIFLIVGGSLIGYNAFVFLMKHVPAAKVATYSYVNPVIAVLLGWWMLGETLTVQQVVGAAVILGGVVLVNRGVVQVKKT